MRKDLGAFSKFCANRVQENKSLSLRRQLKKAHPLFDTWESAQRADKVFFWFFCVQRSHVFLQLCIDYIAACFWTLSCFSWWNGDRRQVFISLKVYIRSSLSVCVCFPSARCLSQSLMHLLSWLQRKKTSKPLSTNPREKGTHTIGGCALLKAVICRLEIWRLQGSDWFCIHYPTDLSRNLTGKKSKKISSLGTSIEYNTILIY